MSWEENLANPLVPNSQRTTEEDMQSAVSSLFEVKTVERRASTLGGVLDFNSSGLEG